MPIASFASPSDMIVSPLTPSALPAFVPPQPTAQIAQLAPASVQQPAALAISASDPHGARANTADTPLVLTNQTSINDMRQNHVAEFLPMRQVQQVTDSTAIEA